MSVSLELLHLIAEDRLADLLLGSVEIHSGKLRFSLTDGSTLDVHLSETLKGHFSFHWERRHLSDTFYRFDTFPDRGARRFRTFPAHFHNGTKLQSAPFRTMLPESFEDFV